MTQKEALEQALKDLGGRAHLQEIYPVALKYITHKEGSKIYDSLRGCIHDKRRFRPSPGMPTGWYELLSFQEEIASRDSRIAELEELLTARDKEISELKKQETADLFVGRMIGATKTVFATKRNDARPVQQVLVVMNRPEQQELMEWIIGKPTKITSKTITKKIIQKTINKGNTYVDHQTVIPSVGNFQPQITTQNIEASMPSLGQQPEQKHLEDE